MTDHDKLREAIEHIRKWGTDTFNGSHTKMAIVLAAAESTLPKTRMVEVWRVEWASHHATRGWSAFSKGEGSLAEAESYVRYLKSVRTDCQCIRVTGPHMQEVPA